MIIYTHYHLDLDAASSAALALVYNKTKNPVVKFISASTTKDEFNALNKDDEYIILDIDCNGIGIKGEQKQGKVYSAFSSYLDTLDDVYKEYFKEAAYSIDMVDIGEFVKNDALIESFNYFRNNNLSDSELITIWTKYLNGLMIEHDSYQRAIDESKLAQWPYKNIALVKHMKEKQTRSILENHGAEFVIYTDKNNMGVIISDTVDRGFAKLLGPSLDSGWFIHPSGFLVCWGSRVAKKDTPPTLTARELADIIHNLY